MLPKFKRAARNLDGGAHFTVVSKTTDAWEKIRGSRPFARTRHNTSGLQLIKTADRTLLIAPLATERSADDDRTARPDTSFVVLERFKEGPKKSKTKETLFHPVRTDLSADKSVSLYRREDGKWAVYGAKSTTTNPAAWLTADDASRLSALRPDGSICKVGNRELCGVTLHSGYDLKTHQKQAVIERERTPNGIRYRLLDGNLKPGADVAPIDGSPAEERFVSELLDRVAANHRWPDAQTRTLAQHAALTAFHAGAGVADAAALSELMLLSARTDLGDNATAAYGQAAAIAGTLLAQGQPFDQVRSATIDLLRTAEWLQAGAPETPASGETADIADAISDIREAPRSTRSGATSEPSATVNAEEAARYALRTALRTAQEANFDGYADALVQTRSADRHGQGPQMSALHALAREYFVEKVTDVGTLRAVAQRAAGSGIAKMQDHAATLGREAAALDKDIADTRDLLAQAERAGATPPLDTSGFSTAARRTSAEISQNTGWTSRLFGWGTGRAATTSSTPRPTAASERTVGRRDDASSLRDTSPAPIHSTGDVAALRATLRTQTDQAALLHARAHDLSTQVERITRTLGPGVDAMVAALIDAHGQTPGNQSAALSASTAAWRAVAEGADAANTAQAASTAHLARLAGGDDDAAQTVGARMASLCNDGIADPGTDAARAHQLSLVQSAIHGEAPWTEASANNAMLNAVAALPSLVSAEDVGKKNRTDTAAILKASAPAPTAADTLVLATGAAPMFHRVKPPAAPKVALSESEASGIPERYEAIATRFDPSKGAPVDGLNHAKVRTVTDAGFQNPTGVGATHYMIELAGSKGRQWVDFAWSANMNQLYGEVSVKPTRHATSAPTAAGNNPSADDDHDVGAEVKVVVAFNGFSAKWESFAKRTSDLKTRTDAAMHEIDQLVTSRDSSLSWRNLSYSGADSGHLDNIVPQFKIRIEEEIRLFAQGRHSQPLFKDNLSKLFIELAQSIESDRSRKKSITRHQIDSTVRVVAAVAVGGGIGGARLGAVF
ncbi:hypothetical protein [Robbsia sp. KACC 23696]|uniref:hypothetical protein n=1 Tax=Robbsia sp. KACC 23696 TaxID=3149231 RepID=UPI00325AED5E